MSLPSHPALSFPVYLHFGHYTIHPHLFFETLSYLVGFRIYLLLRRRFGDPIATPLRWATLAAAVAGAAFGAKLLFWLEDPQITWQHRHDPAYLIGGKTIVGALAFGLILVEQIKRYIGLRTSTGDLYAIPLALGIAIGRIGCFLTGLPDNTYGTATALPWGVNFGDGILRHPTQLYEIIFLLLLIPILYRILNRIALQQENVILSENFAQRSGAPEATRKIGMRKTAMPHVSLPLRDVGSSAAYNSGLATQDSGLTSGDAFKLFMVAYMTFRLLCDFIKPYPRIFLGLGGIQWACVLILLYYARDITRWLRGRS